MNRRTIIALALVIVLVVLALLLGPCVFTATADPPAEPAGSSGEPQDPDGGSTG